MQSPLIIYGWALNFVWVVFLCIIVANNLLTRVALYDKMPLTMLEQEPVTKTPSVRELSVGARQRFGFGEFILLVADLKLVVRCQRVD